MKILIINGVNLNILHRRESFYGGLSLDELNEKVEEYAKKIGVETEFFTSNFEGEIVERLHSFDCDGLIINAGAFSHYSLAIADALRSVYKPKIEVHLSNIHQRDRHVSLTAAACDGVIGGLKTDGYLLALDYLKSLTATR